MKTVWKHINYFSPTENWGDQKKINGLLLLLLDKIAKKVREYNEKQHEPTAYCIIHNAYATSGHSPNSQHYKGNAADFHFENIHPYTAYKLIMEVLMEYQVTNFVGLGVYPDWHNPGFHLDVRGYKARWSRINGAYTRLTKGLKKMKGKEYANY